LGDGHPLMSRPTLSLTLPSFGAMFQPRQWREFLDLARAAEDAGVDRLLLTDHVIMSSNVDRYPYGDFPFPPESPWLEPLSTMAAIAAVTTTVRLSTKILIAPLRPAPLLAKTLATIDVLSGGRVEVGVGLGWQREEYEASAVDWSDRGQLLTDTIAVCKALWKPSPTSFSSKSFSFVDVWCEPKPLQSDGIPVWFAGKLNKQNLARITSLGDGWIPPPYGDASGLVGPVKELQSQWVNAGRDPGTVQVQGDPQPVLDNRRKLDLEATMAGVPSVLIRRFM